MKDLFGHNFWNSVFPFWFQKNHYRETFIVKMIFHYILLITNIALFPPPLQYKGLILRSWSQRSLYILDITKGCLIWIKLDEAIKPWKYTIILVNTILIIKNIIISHTYNLVITFQKAFKNKNDDRILNYYRTSLWV